MRALIDLLKSLLIGGIVFLLPIGIVLVVFGKLLAVSRQVAAALQGTLLPGMQSPLLVLAIAVALLLAVALAAGVFARTAAGRALFAWLEGAVLARLPVYTILRQMIADMSGGVGALGEEGERAVVAVDFDDHTAIAFLIDRLATGRAVVYLPGAPSALSGQVVIVDSARVRPTELDSRQVIGGMRRLGAGMARLVAAERAAREG